MHPTAPTRRSRPQRARPHARSRLAALAVIGAVLLSTAACLPVPPRTVQVSLIGDSLSTQAAPSFLSDLHGVTNAVVSTTYNSYPGTAPCDWLTAQGGRPTVAQLAAAHPDVAVLEFVGNNSTPCIAAASASPGGVAGQYAADLTTIVHAFLAAGTPHVIVVGGSTIAPTAVFDPEAVNGRIKQAAHDLVSTAGDARVTWVDAGASVESPTGGYVATLPCTSGEIFFQLCSGPVIGGVTQESVRALDGIHLCQPGAFFNCAGYSSGAARFAGTEVGAIDALYGLAPRPIVP